MTAIDGDPDPISAGTAGDAALWGGSSAAVGMAAGACGSGEGAAEPLGSKLGGSVATLADCADWRGGAHERIADALAGRGVPPAGGADHGG